jgi:hypothetical protein
MDSAAPTGHWRGSIGMLPSIVKAKDLEILAANLLMPKVKCGITEVTGIIRQLDSCHGPAGGAPVAGAGGGGTDRAHPAGQAPQLSAAGRDKKGF